MITAVDIEKLKQSFDPKKGPQTLDEWIYLGGDSLDVLNNAVVANARLARAIGEVITTQKNLIQEIAGNIEAVSNLNADLSALKSTDPDLSKTAPIGKTVEEAQAIYDRLKVEIDLKDDIKKIFEESLNASPPKIPALTGQQFNTLQTQLQGRSETLTTKSQQENLKLQTLTSRFTQGYEAASSTQQKDSQNKGTVINNLRGI